MEQEEYTKEQINWSYIEFVDNQDVLDLIEKVLNFSSPTHPIIICHSEDISDHACQILVFMGTHVLMWTSDF